LLPVPVGLLQLLGRLSGREAQAAQLCGSLALDTAQTRQKLGWSPAVSVDEGLQRTVNWYLAQGRRGAS
jgi:UDP-glucose 4-epimerase